MNEKSDLHKIQTVEPTEKSGELSIQNIHLQSECDRLQTELNSRMKELNAIYKISSLPPSKVLSMDGFLQEVTKILQSSYPDPDKTSIRIAWGNSHHQTANFTISNWKQSENIVVDGQPAGLIEIFYPGQESGPYQSSLTGKKQILLKVVADRLGNEMKQINAEENCMQFDAFYHSMVEMIPFGMDIINESGEILFANEILKKEFDTEVVGKKCWEAYCTDRNQCRTSLFNDELPVGQTIICESAGISGNRIFEINQSGFIYNGQRACLEIFQEITEKKRFEQELLKFKSKPEKSEGQGIAVPEKEISPQIEAVNASGESETRYRDLVDFSTSIVLEFDSEGKIMYLNKYGFDFFGFTPEELYGQHVVGTIVEPFDSEGFDLDGKMKIVSSAPDGFYSSENENVKKNGEKVWIAWTNKGFYNANGQLVKTLSVGIDRTRQHELEKLMTKYREELEKKVKDRTGELIKSKAELEESEVKYRLIAENMSDGILIIGADARIKYMSPSYLKLLGYTEEETVSKDSEYIFSIIHPEDRDLLFSRIYEAIVQKRSDLIYAYRARHKNGHYVWREDHAKLNYNEKNEHTDIYIICRDITERKEAEDKIRQNEERLQGILDNMQDAYFQTDLLGNISFANQMALKMYGYMSEGELIGKSSLLLYADKNEKARLLDKLKTIGKTTDFITKGVRKDGTIFWVSMNIQFIFDDKGNICGTKGVVSDISNRIKLEKEIVAAKEEAERNEKKYQNLFHSMQEGVYLHKLIYDKHGNPVDYRVIEGNPASEKYLGIKNKDAIGKLATELYGTDQAPSLDIYANVVKTGVPYAFEEYFEPMGKHFYVSVFSQAKDEFATVFLDISKQKHHETELFEAKQKAEENERKLLNSQEIAKLGGWELDVDTGLFTFNESFYNLFHTNAKEMGGYQLSLHEYASQFVYPDDAEMVAEETRKAIETDDPDYTNYLEHRFFYKDGGIGHLSVRFYIKKDQNGRTIKTYGVNQDITEKRKAEIELIKAKEKSEQSDHLKTAFLLNISHEIRTPMNGILGFMSLLKEPGLTENEKSDYIKIVNQSGERLMNTINDIVEISKIEAGYISLTKQDFDVSELMQYHYDFFKLQAEEKGLEFDMNLKVKGESAFINSDKQKLDGILMNLIRNAIKFTEKGKIEIGNYIENNDLYFYVKDTGKGIPKDKAVVIFDRFVQVEQGYSRGYEGSGIGLSIVKAYIEALGGTIEVNSTVDKGSTFLFSIPYHPVMKHTLIAEKNENKEIVHPGEIILIAEDDPVNYYLLEVILSGEYRLLHAFNGEETIKILTEKPDIQLILLDIKMPGKYDGLEATRQIRALNRNVPIIAQTAYATENDKLKAIEAGCNDFLTKPYTKTELFSLIRKYIAK